MFAVYVLEYFRDVGDIRAKSLGKTCIINFKGA